MTTIKILSYLRSEKHSTMKHIFTLILLTFCAFGYSQENFNLELQANVSVGETGNDIWGFVDSTGIEYAVMGSRTKVSIFSLEDPTNPILRSEVPGAPSTWRDMKSYKDHIYFTTDEGSDGLGIIDMSMAPDSITYTYWQPEISIDGFTDILRRCHNLYIDEAGYCYLAGCNIPDQFNTNGIIILDLNQDPKSPEILGNVTRAYSHDVYVRDTLMYCSEIYNGEFAIYSIADKLNPQLLATQRTSSTFSHNAWLSDDGNYLYTTDEVPNAFVDGYDISDFDDIRRTDLFKPAETSGTGVIPHNTHFYNGYLVTSWYTDGVVITDAHDPNNLVKVASFDTFFDEANTPDPMFAGCWGAYPFLPSGLVLASDMQTGLYVFQPNYVRAAYLEGNVTDFDSGDNISGASIRMLNQTSALATTNANGNYKGGTAAPGEIELVFEHPFYFSDTITAEIVSGEVTIIDAQLKSRATIIKGKVIDTDGNNVANANVLTLTEGQKFADKANITGDFELPVLEGTSLIFGGGWGYKTNFMTYNPGDDPNITIIVERGYRDEFVLDLGWTIDGDAETGAWERGVPQGTTFEGSLSNPGSDVNDDIGDECYITGNGGGGAGDDDIDSGVTILTSPKMDLTTYQNPTINFDYWFFNEGGFGNPNDKLEMFLFNGTDVTIAFNVDETTDGWQSLDSVVIQDIMEVTDNMWVEFVTADQEDSGHLVEAAIDLFEIKDGVVSNTIELDHNSRVALSPNPVSDILTIESKEIIAELVLVNITGQVVNQWTPGSYDIQLDVSEYKTGTYFVLGKTTQGFGFIEKIQILK